MLLAKDSPDMIALTSLGGFLMIVILAASLTYKFIEVPMRNYLKSTILTKQ
jgi:peptidoglycan/LPS O-acetylase OafA/YrhL